jgi:hypothetical protein
MERTIQVTKKKEERTMSFFNEQFLPIIQRYVEQIRAEAKTEFSTVDLIRRYIRHFHSDGTNPHESINANIGKFLGENAKALGIKEKIPDQSCKDDDGNLTSTYVWEFI